VPIPLNGASAEQALSDIRRTGDDDHRQRREIDKPDQQHEPPLPGARPGNESKAPPDSENDRDDAAGLSEENGDDQRRHKHAILDVNSQRRDKHEAHRDAGEEPRRGGRERQNEKREKRLRRRGSN